MTPMRKYLISAAALALLAAPSAWADPPAGHEDRGHEDRGHDAPQAHAEQPARQGGPQGGHFGHPDQPRAPAPQAAAQPQNRPDQNRDFGRGNRGGAPQMAIQAAPNRGDQNRTAGAPAYSRGPGPQIAVQPGTNRVDPNRNNNDGRMGYNGRAGDDRNSNNGRMGFNGRGGDNRNAFNDFNREGRTNYRAPGAGGSRHDFSGFRDFHRDFRAPHHFQVSAYRRPAGWYNHRWAFGEFLPTAFWARDYWLVDFAEYDLPPPPYGAVWVRVDRDALLIDEDSGEVITVEYDVFY
jgi:Ni/Co efflux regulator RcnB